MNAMTRFEQCGGAHLNQVFVLVSYGSFFYAVFRIMNRPDRMVNSIAKSSNIDHDS